MKWCKLARQAVSFLINQILWWEDRLLFIEGRVSCINCVNAPMEKGPFWFPMTVSKSSESTPKFWSASFISLLNTILWAHWASP
jgi:hypothetical protein